MDKKKFKDKLKMNFKNVIQNVDIQDQDNEDKIKKDIFLEDLYYFKNQKILGQGAHGVVLEVYSKQTNQKYAVKIIKTDNQEIFQQCKNTFLLEKKLKHQLFVQAQKIFIDEEKKIIQYVMDFCPYKELYLVQQEKEEQYFSEEDTKKIINQIAQGVYYLHDQQICHRDLKPQNILFESFQNIKIIDFGVAKQFNDNINQKKVKMMTDTGTLHYKAPELFLKQMYTEKIDVWSIGIITYQLLFNQLPFDSDLQKDLIEQIINEQVSFSFLVQEVSPLCQDFISRCLKKNPEQRMDINQVKQHPWIYNQDINQNEIDSKMLNSNCTFKLNNQYQNSNHIMTVNINKMIISNKQNSNKNVFSIQD